MTVWENYRAEAEDYRELDSERVLVLMRHGGRSRTSGVEVGHLDKRGANLFHIRDGKVVRLTFYCDIADPGGRGGRIEATQCLGRRARGRGPK
jgi:ketosteroid isomerase-like protein